MSFRRYPFTTFAVVASLLWIGLLIAGDAIHATAPGRAYLGVTRVLIIPLYVLQTLLIMVVIGVRGGPPTSPDPAVIGVPLGVAEWLLPVLPFYLIDRWRLRRMQNGRSESGNSIGVHGM